MANTEQIFPVSRIAEVLGVDRKTVREQLAGADDALSRPLVVNGQAARGWPLSAIPAHLQTRIEQAAKAQGFDSPERFLAHGKERWSPPRAVGQLPASAIEAARQRCEVLAPVLRQLCDRPVAEIVREAAAAWTMRPRHAITESTLRRWIERAMARDRGYRDWSRWEIYLDDNLTAARPADVVLTPRETPAALAMPHLVDALASIALPAAPTADERAEVWFQAMKDADWLEAAGRSPAEVQRAAMLAIESTRVPISRTVEGLRKTFLRKREAWIAGGRKPSALRDGRALDAKEREWTVPHEDKLVLLKLGLNNGGRLAPAFREAIRAKLLSPATLARFASLPAEKSYVPPSIRRDVAKDLDLLASHHLGPRAARLAGPWTERDWSSIEPGDWWVGDDLTPPVYWWEDVAGVPTPMRGQLLMLCDAKTDFPLGWVLLSSRNYNARAIRSLITRCHDEHGLPREGFHFEHGIWKESRILRGERVDADAVGLEETEKGLGEFGCKFKYANTPGQKTIERVFGLLQNRMEVLPGYCGRDERRDCPEVVRQQLAAVAAGREHPAKYFLSKEAFAQEVEKIIAEHAAEKYGPRSRKIPNQSPKEAYEVRRTDDLVHLDDRSRYLLSNHRVPVTVGRNGVRLRGSLGGGLYRNEETGALVGQKMLAWVDVDAPAVLTLTTLNRENPILVERAPEPRALGAEPYEIRAAERSRRGHAAYGQALYRIVAGAARNRFRSVVVDRATQQLGADIERQKAARAQSQREAANLSATLDRITQAEGLEIPKPTNPAKLRATVESLQSDDSHWDEVRRRAQKDVEL